MFAISLPLVEACVAVPHDSNLSVVFPPFSKVTGSLSMAFQAKPPLRAVRLCEAQMSELYSYEPVCSVYSAAASQIDHS